MAASTFSLIGRARALALTCLLVLPALAAAPARAADGPYGKTLEKTFELPLAELARFERYNQSPTLPSGQPKETTGLMADSAAWASEPIAVAQQRNPWRIVIKAHAVATADGTAELRWQPGWTHEGVTRNTVPAVASRVVKAGEGFELITAAAPVSFKEDQQIAASVGFVKSTNLRLDRVTVEVWSGIGSASWVEKLLGWQAALVGLVMLALALKWRSR